MNEALDKLKLSMKVDSRKEALMQLFWRFRLAEHSPRVADRYGRLRSYVLRHELFTVNWKEGTQKLKRMYGVNNSWLALALFLHQLGYISEDPRKI